MYSSKQANVGLITLSLRTGTSFVRKLKYSGEIMIEFNFSSTLIDHMTKRRKFKVKYIIEEEGKVVGMCHDDIFLCMISDINFVTKFKTIRSCSDWSLKSDLGFLFVQQWCSCAVTFVYEDLRFAKGNSANVLCMRSTGITIDEFRHMPEKYRKKEKDAVQCVRNLGQILRSSSQEKPGSDHRESVETMRSRRIKTRSQGSHANRILWVTRLSENNQAKFLLHHQG